MSTRREFLKVSAGATVTLLACPSAGASSGHEGGKTYAYTIDSTKCIGCGSCVRACRAENKVPEHRYRTWVERYTVTETGGVLAESPEGGEHGWEEPVVEGKVAKSFFFPKLCNHCSNAPCTQVCPVGATFHTPDGVVLVDPEHCVGCGYCVQSCPYGARFLDDTHTASKCTWCYHRITRGLEPACVSVCPVEARQFGEVSPGSDMERRLNEERLMVLKPDLGTEPKVFYTGISKEVR